MNIKKNINKIYSSFLFIHLFIWVLVPSVSNVNLPLDTIEALAWGSNLDWGFSKHPPLSAFFVEVFYYIFGSIDWVYYLLSQIFVLIAFIYVWKLSLEIFNDKIQALLSVLLLEGVFFYNFTTPEFNVNISQIPFWALTCYYYWKCLQLNKKFDWFLFGVFSALGFLSKYLFIYLLISIFLFSIFYFKKNRRLTQNYFLSIVVSLIILIPHFMWLFENNFITIFYGVDRSNLDSPELIHHLTNPSFFLFKQFIILIPFFLMTISLLTKFQLNIKKVLKKNYFLFSITILPVLLMLVTSIITGAKIRTMWMTPFYLFYGTLFIQVYKSNITFKKLKTFTYVFIFFFVLSPSLYLGVSILDNTKRTDYPGKEISRLVQNKWNDNFINEIKIVVGDEWYAGNLSYHLASRPSWVNDLKDKSLNITDNQGVIYTGNPEILKKICPGVFGTIKPVGYCMIGKR